MNGFARHRDVWAILFAIIFPTLSAWAYFRAAGTENGAFGASSRSHENSPASKAPDAKVRLAYGLGKGIQFIFPVAWILIVDRKKVWPRKPTAHGLEGGLAFGLAVGVAGIALYAWALRNSRLFENAPYAISAKLASFGADSPARYIVFTAFLAIVHSLLEEYYWRWFVFKKLRNRFGFFVANGAASIAFAAYHAVLLAAFFPGHFLILVTPLCVCIAVGGFVWAWLYERTDSIYAPWLSHLLIDAAIFAVGYDLAFVKAVK